MAGTLTQSLVYVAMTYKNSRSLSVSCACLNRATSYAKAVRSPDSTASSAHAGDLAIQADTFGGETDDEDSSLEDDSCTSLADDVSENSSVTDANRLARLDEMFEDESRRPTFAEALWDHVTLDPEELGFEAGDVVEVTDMVDKDWWWGVIGHRQGWFPAAFVRIRANQSDTTEDLVSALSAGALCSAPGGGLRRAPPAVSPEQARANVIREILNAETEYVKHLKDVVQGYVEKARKRPEMFTDECLTTIFGNIEEIYTFSKRFLHDLEAKVDSAQLHNSNIGQCFLQHQKGFEIYSEYCNNHPLACEELRRLQKNKKYQHFWEACRLLQQMIEIPLEGFLLTPVQKICKYPLQLKELLKYTGGEHADREQTQRALDTMRHIATLINERKRKMESLEKLAQWQSRIVDWEDEDLIERSSELIHSSEMTKVNSSGWHQDRVFFLFDHQLVYCKKDLLWRDLLVYKGRLDLDQCDIQPVDDTKDVKNAFRIYDNAKAKWYVVYCRSILDKLRWLEALQEERRRVQADQRSGLDLSKYREKVRQAYLTNKGKKLRVSNKDYIPKVPSHVHMPHDMTTQEGLRYVQHTNSGAHKQQRTHWFPFLKKKTKR